MHPMFASEQDMSYLTASARNVLVIELRERAGQLEQANEQGDPATKYAVHVLRKHAAALEAGQ